jgi:hypothetical protein
MKRNFKVSSQTSVRAISPGLSCATFEKWLRRGSKIFSAKKTTGRYHDAGRTVNVISGKAENIEFAAREPFLSGYAIKISMFAEPAV